jgi:uncharacterized protein YhaN
VRINQLSLTAFGSARHVELSNLAAGLTVVYGANEAGKTTLMNFLRAMLYGFDQARRGRYVPPAGGGDASGRLDVSGAEGRATLARTAPADAALAEELSILSGDGSPRRAAWLAAALSDVDEPTFNHVFAVGLGEVQELATLSDSQAASWLYDISAGRDRVSLGEVVRELAASRNRLIAADGRASVIQKLWNQRSQLQTTIAQLAAETNRLDQLGRQRRAAKDEIARLEAQNATLDQRVRIWDAATALSARWQRCNELDAELAALGPVQTLSPGTAAELEEAEVALARLARRRKSLGRKYRKAVAAARRGAVNEVLRRSAPRIEALGEQTPFITSLESQLAQLDTEIVALERESLGESAAGSQSPTMAGSDLALPASFDANSPRYAALRPAAKRMREAQQRLDDAELEVQRARQANAQAAAEQQSTGKHRHIDDLPAAIEKAGLVVSQLRRRMQIDERLVQIERSGLDVEEDNRHAMADQLLPAWAMLTFGVAFVVGVVMLLWGLITWRLFDNPWGVLAAMGGLAAGGIAALAKWRWEDGAQRKLETGLRQLDALRRETKQLHNERDELDIELPSGGGPLAVRLQAGERELASLEGMLSANVRRSAVFHDIAGAELRRDQQRTELDRAKNKWGELLRIAGLPSDFAPHRLRELNERGGKIAELKRQLAAKQALREQRRSEWTAVAARVTQLATEVGMAPAIKVPPVTLVGQLVAALRSQDAAVAEQQALRDAASALRKRKRKLAVHAERLGRKRRELLAAFGVAGTDEFKAILATAAKATQLRSQREVLHAEILAAAKANGQEAAVLKLLESGATGSRDDYAGDATQLAAHRAELRKLYEQLGRLDSEMETLSADRRICEARFDLQAIEQQLDDALRQFQLLSGASRVLEAIRENYERNRQPQTLVEASVWLARLTEGKYRRVWTPFGEQALRVDGGDGKSLPVEVLSRGAREQLFLALRLAIISNYAERGVRLPIIFDDVLVNFDVHRAAAAASVLADFARAGHQIFVFTCHEHIERLFDAAGADVRRLGSEEIERRQPLPVAQPAIADAEPRRGKLKRARVAEPIVLAERSAAPRPRGIFYHLPIAAAWQPVWQLPIMPARVRAVSKPAEVTSRPIVLPPVEVPTVPATESVDVFGPRGIWGPPIVVAPPAATHSLVVENPTEMPEAPIVAATPEVAGRPMIRRLVRPSRPALRPAIRLGELTSRPKERTAESPPIPPATPRSERPPEPQIAEPQAPVRRVRWRSKGWDPAIEVPIEEEAVEYDEARGGDPIAMRRAATVQRPASAPQPMVTPVYPLPPREPQLPAAEITHGDATEAEFAEYEAVMLDDQIRLVRRAKSGVSAA